MSTKTDAETNGCTFQWKIVNISHCWLKLEQVLVSHAFIADALEGTKWLLWFYPFQNENNIAKYLYRSGDCSGPNTIHVNYRLDLMDKDGEFLTASSPTNLNFYKGYAPFLKEFGREEIFVTKRETFLHEDTLTIHCSIWKGNETLSKSQQLSARTVFNVNRRSFVWKIHDFSSLKPGVKNKFKDEFIDFHLVLNKILEFGKKLDIDVVTFNESLKYFSLKTSIITSERETEECGGHEYYANDLKKGILYTLFFTKKLMENKSRYLPNDVLSLDCEYVSSNGSYQHEICCYGIIYPKVTKMVAEIRHEHCAETEKPPQSLVLANDLKSMYNDDIFSDTELRTSTQTFPAHKFILIARSPVFRRMFSNDMKENNSGHIDITDLEDDTVHRMLLYMYTDALEDLQLENACKLYVASDKYEILSLRSRCSSFLKANLCPTKACEVLSLANLHHDDDLKSAVQDYILKYDKEVFVSQEWKQFMDTNPKLAAEIMYRKVCPG